MSLQIDLMLLLEPHVLVPFSAFFLSVFLCFISISEIPYAESSQCILVIFRIQIHFDMSIYNLKYCPVIQWHRRIGNTAVIKGQRFVLAVLNFFFKHRSLNVLRAIQSMRNTWFYPEFEYMLVCFNYAESPPHPFPCLDESDNSQHQISLLIPSHSHFEV